MTVFVVQQPPDHISLIEATDFGELNYLLERYQQITSDKSPIVDDLKDKLKNFTLDDYLLCYGDPAAIGVACAIIAKINGGKIPILKWDRRATKYYTVTIDLSDVIIKDNLGNR